jgi:hypothetical protein
MATTSPWPLIHAEREAPEAVIHPHLSLILAMTGRSGALADLSGEGLGTLKSRSQE